VGLAGGFGAEFLESDGLAGGGGAEKTATTDKVSKNAVKSFILIPLITRFQVSTSRKSKRMLIFILSFRTFIL
jgi:hypothetical protein